MSQDTTVWWNPNGVKMVSCDTCNKFHLAHESRHVNDSTSPTLCFNRLSPRPSRLGSKCWWSNYWADCFRESCATSSHTRLDMHVRVSLLTTPAACDRCSVQVGGTVRSNAQMTSCVVQARRLPRTLSIDHGSGDLYVGTVNVL